MRSHSLFLMLILAACGRASSAGDSAGATLAVDTAVRAGPATGRASTSGTLTGVNADGPNGSARFTAEDSLPTTVQDAAVDVPRLVRVGKRSVLHLPPRMMAALRSALPGFRTFRRADYSPTIRDTIYGDPAKEAQFAAIGDFDGDGRLDVALFGRTDSAVVVLAILNEAKGPRVLEVQRGSDDELPAGGIPLIEGWLSYEAPGDRDYGGQRVQLDHDAFAVSEELGSTLYFYKNGKFGSVTAGD